MPHEGAVRAWLARARISREDSDDIIQDAYCRLAALDTVDQILRPDAYFFSIVRNEMIARLQRSRVVPIETAAELDALVDDTKPSPEQEAGGRRDYARLRSIMASLPDRCRRIVEMRKFEGRSQKEIADQLGVTESIVENDVYAGVRAIRRAWQEGDAAAAQRLVALASNGKSA